MPKNDTSHPKSMPKPIIVKLERGLCALNVKYVLNGAFNRK